MHLKVWGSERKIRAGENLEESSEREGKPLAIPSIFQKKTKKASFEAEFGSLGRLGCTTFQL